MKKLAIIMFSLLSCRLYSSSISSSLGKKQRFDSILELISPSSQYIADIGTDHGLLPLKIAEYDHILKIYAIDSSPLALEGARKNILQVKSIDIQKKIEILEGNGLNPILKYKVETIICAGMGSNTAQDICNHNHLDSINCDRIILQPWPNHLFPLLKLYKYLTDTNNWIIDDQRIIQSGHYQHLTTSFKRRQTISNNNSLLSWPLTKRLLQNNPKDTESKVFLDYLINQNENFFRVKKGRGSLSSDSTHDILISAEKDILEIIGKKK